MPAQSEADISTYLVVKVLNIMNKTSAAIIFMSSFLLIISSHSAFSSNTQVGESEHAVVQQEASIDSAGKQLDAESLLDDRKAGKEGEGNDLLILAQEQFSKKKYDQSILSSQRYISRYEDLADIALFNQVRCFLKNSDTRTAEVILKKLKGSHPASPYSKLTMEQIDNLPATFSIVKE
jgi:hypothetical protein